MNITPFEAQVRLLNAVGLSVRAIAKQIGKTDSVVRNALERAKHKTLSAGLCISYQPVQIASDKESGFTALKRLAEEAGLKK